MPKLEQDFGGKQINSTAANLLMQYNLSPQPQSTDFTQYNSYGDMCGGGRGESCE